MAENNKVYPEGTSKETEEFKERREVNDIANELIKKVAIEKVNLYVFFIKMLARNIWKEDVK